VSAEPQLTGRPLATPAVVLFDLDFTLLQPSDEFAAAGYRRTGARFGLRLDVSRWPEAERAAYRTVKARRRAQGDGHDSGLLVAIAQAVIEGLGGHDDESVQRAAEAVAEAWSKAENFGLYDDVFPCLERLREAGLRLALLSNAVGHSLEEVVVHFALDAYIEAAISSADVGFMKPAPQLFRRALETLGVEPGAAVMVGDSVEEDCEGAKAAGCGAVLLDRSGRGRGTWEPRITTLTALPRALGL
jgi:2-haloalkanoic acid dehalogenase type II